MASGYLEPETLTSQVCVLTTGVSPCRFRGSSFGRCKMVINVPMNGPKSQSRALKIVVGISGVELAQLGENQIVVVGSGVDPVKLTNLLRERMERKIGRCWFGM